ncbi:MAG: carbonic anhydrase [Bacteroidales bacterium]|nr:carbonic anhydrase [Bacteroidales bacterium]
MQGINEGVIRFRQNDFEANREHFENIGREQKPHTLFIGCSDSRVVPSLITQTIPGELFIIRNIANLVPKYRESAEYLATTSAIEYAVLVLEVENIIVCGHSNCGGCAALYETPENMAKIPHTRRWLELAMPVKEKVLKMALSSDLAAREWLTEQMNVVEQLGHLMTYPYINERVKSGKIELIGWHYMIHTGSIYEFHRETGEFELIGS